MANRSHAETASPTLFFLSVYDDGRPLARRPRPLEMSNSRRSPPAPHQRPRHAISIFALRNRLLVLQGIQFAALRPHLAENSMILSATMLLLWRRNEHHHGALQPHREYSAE
ncbi:hypothetical protein J3459_018220 [Metarhizium acridum]|uniref:Uncharacterized protein n=1 Tax=Metarhizium acridum (strain CQMa 102) TaxID=655827 RepID=E9EH69_METAQ|nr:uncharacterized protein MAC_09217 [Metarhizium acridum CQMa 102]EFY84733.1 hypothetical protein MAC_09217 [Metarhizium acridum CQMa 102]KAG8408063.1 hypothetical protein J3459_018220 [Metarhizium acridum]KAG8411727.1 hypothetical protein J3458_015313 [Metarhizium acridum]